MNLLGLFSIFREFDRNGMRLATDQNLGIRGVAKVIYSYGGDCVGDVMDVEPFWDHRDDIRVCSSDTILDILRGLVCDNVKHQRKGSDKHLQHQQANERPNAQVPRHH